MRYTRRCSRDRQSQRATLIRRHGPFCAYCGVYSDALTLDPHRARVEGRVESLGEPRACVLTVQPGERRQRGRVTSDRFGYTLRHGPEHRFRANRSTAAPTPQTAHKAVLLVPGRP